MKASLIWPQFTEFSHLDGTWLPHGITQIATEANLAGHEVDILDGRSLGREGVVTILRDTDVEVVGISLLSALMGAGIDLCRWLADNRPDLKICLGGIHPTVAPEDVEDLPYTWLVQGEGEVSFTEILDGKVPPGVVKGKSPDLDKLHPVDRSLVRIEEQGFWGAPGPFATVIIGRGCPHRCTFCWPSEELLFGKRLRYRSVDSVVFELDSLGVGSFMIHDDCFTAMKSYVEEFCDKVKHLNAQWWCQGRADDVCNNLDMVRKMRDSGLVGMILGHESGDQRVLDSLHKGTTVEQNLESVRILNALGIAAWSNIMLGTPFESPSAVLNTIHMVHEMNPQITSLSIFTPHPGSVLYHDCADRILRQPGDWEYFNRGRFEPKILGPDYAFLAWATQQINKEAGSEDTV